MRSGRDDFKPIQAEFGLTANAAWGYTERPDVTATTVPLRRGQDEPPRQRGRVMESSEGLRDEIECFLWACDSYDDSTRFVTAPRNGSRSVVGSDGGSGPITRAPLPERAKPHP